ncbi:site-specific DNA-methyltransferase [Treponema porcinum]|uniref:site-specific DNA-methyltransferase n=1 Tax=Treponema porcinum TaxID=261392 RepID=UPI003F731FBF
MTDHLKMHSLNKIDENIAKIARLFPNCVTEAKDENGELTHKIDFDMLKQELSHSLVEGREERYQFTWPDKKQAILTANAPINKTLRPCREESVNFDETENLYIEGDNLEVLKLLQETYLGKIKMIYIDPPYNTGNDFVYNDDFSQDADDYMSNSGQTDEEGNRLVANTESNGRFHTDWLNMMYPRLKLARDLLSDDGVIFISIDDNEIENLSKICNEIYGENNFIGRMTLLSNPRGSQNSKNLSYVHESILMYSKSYDELDIGGIKKSEESLSEFSEKDENGKLYRLLGLRKRGGAWRKEDRPNMFYSIYVNPKNGKCSLNKDSDFCVEVIPKRPTGELSRWTWGKEKFSEEKDKLIGKPINRSGEEDAWDIFRKDYKDNPDGEEKTTKLKTMWIEKETNYQNAKNEIKALFGNSEIFDFPKPTYIVSRLSTIITEEQDIILDFFSGSATTAHAVMQLNAEDGGNRKFIMVQLPEPCDEKSEAYKAGYKNICEIGKERIRRAGKQILELSLEHLEKEGVIEKYAGKLSEIRSLEEIYGFSGESLSVGEKTSESGNVCSVGSDEKSGGVDSIEYSGRTSERNQRVHSISENSKGVSCRIGDTTIDLRTLELLNNLGYRIKFESFGGDKQNDLFSDNNSNSETLSTQLSALKSKLSVLTTLDIGFRVLKCDTSNMEDVYYTPDHIDKQDLFKNNIKSDRTAEDLLFQVMLDLGIMLSSKIQTKQIDGKTVYCVEGNYLVACFDEDVTEETITKIAKEKPYYFVMRDASMANDSVATNFEQIFKTYLGESYNPDNIRII